MHTIPRPAGSERRSRHKALPDDGLRPLPVELLQCRLLRQLPFVVHYQDRFDAARPVCSQGLLDPLRRRTGAPFLLLDHDIKTDALSKFYPEMAELTKARHKDFVAGRQRVAECGLPSTCAAGRKNKDLSRVGLEDFLYLLKQAQRKLNPSRPSSPARPGRAYWLVQEQIGNCVQSFGLRRSLLLCTALSAYRQTVTPPLTGRALRRLHPSGPVLQSFLQDQQRSSTKLDVQSHGMVKRVRRPDFAHKLLVAMRVDDLCQVSFVATRPFYTLFTAGIALWLASAILAGLATGGLPMPTHEQETVITFAPDSTSTTSGNADQLDRAGQTILQLLNKAAGVAEENSRNAIEMAQRLSHKLREAEGRIAELEAQAAAYREQAERAEQWLHRVYTEMEQRFLRQDQNARRGVPQRR
jgi:hypothetical protein